MSASDKGIPYFKITVRVTATVDAQQRTTIHVHGQLQPDYARYARTRYIQAALSSKLPRTWLN